MNIEARVHSLYTAPTETQGLEKVAVPTIEVTHEGFAGDKHAGFLRKADGRTPQYARGELIRNDRQWSGVSLEELKIIAEAMGIPDIDPAWLGANLAVTMLPNLTELPKGTKLLFPDRTVLVVESENMPCTGPGEVIASKYPEKKLKSSAFPKASIHKRGIVGVVEKPGTITEGDKVSIVVYKAKKYSYPTRT